MTSALEKKIIRMREKVADSINGILLNDVTFLTHLSSYSSGTMTEDALASAAQGLIKGNFGPGFDKEKCKMFFIKPLHKIFASFSSGNNLAKIAADTNYPVEFVTAMKDLVDAAAALASNNPAPSSTQAPAAPTAAAAPSSTQAPAAPTAAPTQTQTANNPAPTAAPAAAPTQTQTANNPAPTPTAAPTAAPSSTQAPAAPTANNQATTEPTTQAPAAPTANNPATTEPTTHSDCYNNKLAEAKEYLEQSLLPEIKREFIGKSVDDIERRDIISSECPKTAPRCVTLPKDSKLYEYISKFLGKFEEALCPDDTEWKSIEDNENMPEAPVKLSDLQKNHFIDIDISGNSVQSVELGDFFLADSTI